MVLHGFMVYGLWFYYKWVKSLLHPDPMTATIHHYPLQQLAQDGSIMSRVSVRRQSRQRPLQALVDWYLPVRAGGPEAVQRIGLLSDRQGTEVHGTITYNYLRLYPNRNHLHPGQEYPLYFHSCINC